MTTLTYRGILITRICRTYHACGVSGSLDTVRASIDAHLTSLSIELGMAVSL